MIEDVQAAIPLGILLGLMIGPVFFVLLETAATKGFRAALFFDIGVIIADIVFILIAYLSSYQLLENLSNQPGLYVFGGAIVLGYGVIVFFQKPKTNEAKKGIKGGYLGLVIKGFLLNFINIGVLAIWLGVLMVAGPNMDNDPNRIVIFFSSMILTYLMLDIVKILLAKQLKRYLTPERTQIFKKALGVLLVICGMVIISRGFGPNKGLEVPNRLEKTYKNMQ